jgi:MFS superfamily sulfate permease-like transporter
MNWNERRGFFFCFLTLCYYFIAVSEFLGDDKTDITKYIHATCLLGFLCGLIKITFGTLRYVGGEERE